jgi:LacI family transcriptional regulator, galactose operon repressor
VTLKDVADLAGLSLATASRVLNGSARSVTADSAARVLRAARELGYVSNGPAQALARSTTSVVGLIVHEVDDPYFSAIAAGAMQVAAAHDLLTMLASTFHDPQREIDYVQRFQAQRVRALLLAGSNTLDPDHNARLDQALSQFTASGGRVAFISDHGLAYPSVLPANSRGGAQVARHLHDLGHDSVGLVAGPAALTTVRDRLEGFATAWQSLGHTLPDSAVVDGNFTRDGGYSAMLELAERIPGLTAVFALNDLMAVGAMAALQLDLGRAVPAEVSVVGFDDLWMADDLSTPLTTVRLPLEEMGAQAMTLVLNDPAVAGTSTPRRVHVPARLVVRGSTGPARARAAARRRATR